jgi:16S rRNA (uracil1498-N3)-methyltransferase
VRRFLHGALPERGTFVLGEDEGAHLARVLRAREGDEVLVFDGRGREAVCRVTSVARDAVTLEVGASHAPRRAARDVLLLTAVPRGERMERLVEACVEAGASGIVPWAAARSVRDRAGPNTLRRWRRAALEACKQCGRADLPEVSDVVPLDAALRQAAGRRVLVARPGAASGAAEARGGAEAVAVLIGPEGGLAPEEDAFLDAAGAVPFGLGPLVLRIETAATIAVHALSS